MESVQNKIVKAALLGAGTVGSGVYELVKERQEDFPHICGTQIEIAKILVRDASKEREEDIMENYNIKDIYFLKVGHHGSKTSTGSSFIKNINPKYSIISVGENNRYGHPNKNTLKNLKDTTIFRTDLNGSIKIKLKKNKYEIKTCAP